MKQRPHQKPWVLSPDADAELQSALAAARFAVDPSQPLVERHRKGILNGCIWLITEGTVGKKYQTRYRTSAAVASKNGPLRHEHVYTRKSLVARMVNGEPVEAVLKEAIGCTVTAEEHDRLRPFDSTHEGWERYRQAGIDVLDMATGDPYLPVMESAT